MAHNGTRAQWIQMGPGPMGPWDRAHGPWDRAHGPWDRAHGIGPMGQGTGSMGHGTGPMGDRAHEKLHSGTFISGYTL